MKEPHGFVQAFRSSSPYINTHRGKTFVISFAGEAIAGENFHQHIQDIALLHALGIRIILIHGIRPQIEARLQRAGVASHYYQDIRVTDTTAMECVKEAAGIVRVELEADFSMGLPNTPMAGARIKAVSGNFITAKPMGVRDGVDYCQTGHVRKVDTRSINEQLNLGNIIIIPPIGYSSTGEVFNLIAEEVANHIASEMMADKLIIMLEKHLVKPLIEEEISQLTSNEVNSWLDTHKQLAPDFTRQLNSAAKACENGVDRVHLLNRMEDGVLLRELFTRDGAGTLISRTPFETLRQAALKDANGILELIQPLERQGTLVERSRERIETEINHYVVIERDGLIIGCAALYEYAGSGEAEFACLALHEAYRGESRGERLLKHLESIARSKGYSRLFVLTTQSHHWFIEKGFTITSPEDLPSDKKQTYNANRNSKVLVKILTTK